MPLRYHVDHDHGRVTVIWHPPVTLEELIDVATRQANEGAWPYACFTDLRSQSQLPSTIHRAVIEHIANLNRIHGRRGPVALVVATSGVGTAQKYAFLAEMAGTQETQVFWDSDDANQWLDEQTRRRRVR